MLKLAGVVLVVGACSLVGLKAADELSVRARLLEEFALAVQVLERELALFRPPLPVLLERMAQGRSRVISKLLTDCVLEIGKGMSFTEIWENRVGELPFSVREKELLCALGQVLGRYDDRGQAQVATRIREELERCAACRRADSITRGRMYRALGATVGGFLVLTLL